MQRYRCQNCKGVFCGWAVIYKLKYKCPNCGGELKKVDTISKKYPDKRKYQKVMGMRKRAFSERL